MKPLLAIGAVLTAVLAAIIFLWPAAAAGPPPIRFGRDTCAHCRMHLSRPGFGGALRDHRGALTTYDDVGCLLRAMRAMHREMPEAWVEDHAGGGFVPLLSAVFVRGAGIDTPMGSGVVAFAEADAARRFGAERGGEVVTLETLLRDPAPGPPPHAAALHPEEAS